MIINTLLAAMPQPLIETFEGFDIVRDDLLDGGTKMRAIMPIIKDVDADEFVYASPAQGYAQIALALCCGLINKKATIFTAKRKVPHVLTRRAKDAGAKIVMVPHGYLNVVTSKAKAYCEKTGAHLVPFGVAVPAAMEGIADAARSLNIKPKEVWSVAGSGVLTRSLQMAWPDAKFNAVVVGTEKADVGNAIRWEHYLKYAQDATVLPPFPSAKNYDAKCWEFICKYGTPGALFWNVGA